MGDRNYPKNFYSGDKRQAYSPSINRPNGFMIEPNDRPRPFEIQTKTPGKLEISTGRPLKIETGKIGSMPNPLQISYGNVPLSPQPRASAITITKKATPMPQPVPKTEFYNKYSIQSFVSEYTTTKGYNEIDISSLGIDMHTTQPLLPNLQSIISDAPMCNSSLQIPESYKALPPDGDPRSKLALFSTETLFFIFYTQTRREMQTAIAQELSKRGFAYDSKTKHWSSHAGHFDYDTWSTGPKSIL